MPVSTTIEIAGLKDTVKALKNIDPELQKQFKTDAARIAQPAVNAGKAVYTQLPLSGMRYKWTEKDRGRKVFPFVISKAVNGVKFRLDTRRNAIGVILVEQKDVAAAVFETAGRATANKLGNSLGFVGAGRTRLIGPAVYKARKSIEGEMTKMIAEASRTVQRSL